MQMRKKIVEWLDLYEWNSRTVVRFVMQFFVIWAPTVCLLIVGRLLPVELVCIVLALAILLTSVVLWSEAWPRR
mgnify:CR=1 FL=1